VGATHFLKTKGLVPKITTRYQPSVEEVDGTDSLVIDLNNQYDTYGSADGEDD
jgi:hypothetical protein